MVLRCSSNGEGRKGEDSGVNSDEAGGAGKRVETTREHEQQAGSEGD